MDEAPAQRLGSWTNSVAIQFLLEAETLPRLQSRLVGSLQYLPVLVCEISSVSDSCDSPINALDRNIDHEIDLRFGHAVGRHEIHDIAERS